MIDWEDMMFLLGFVVGALVVSFWRMGRYLDGILSISKDLSLLSKLVAKSDRSILYE